MLILFADLKAMVALLRLTDPVLLNHLEEHMGAQHDLNLVESVGWNSHTDHVAESMGERIGLHLVVQAVGHLDECLDSDRLQTELHYHHIVHEGVEGHC